jgi:hypothetical protein
MAILGGGPVPGRARRLGHAIARGMARTAAALKAPFALRVHGKPALHLNLSPTPAHSQRRRPPSEGLGQFEF